MRENLKGPAADHLFKLIALQEALNAFERGDSFFLKRAKKSLEEDAPADLAFLETLRTFTEEVPAPSTGLIFFVEALRCSQELGKRLGIFDLPPQDWARAASEFSDLPQEEQIRRLQRGQPDSDNPLRKLCVEVTTSIKAIGAQLVFWWPNQQLASAIYCPNLPVAYYIHALFISRSGVIGWRVCPWCLGRFEQNRVDQEYCSPAHGDAYRMARMRSKQKDKTGTTKRSKKHVAKKTR